jgi:hypothetical protein
MRRLNKTPKVAARFRRAGDWKRLPAARALWERICAERRLVGREPFAAAAVLAYDRRQFQALRMSGALPEE